MYICRLGDIDAGRGVGDFESKGVARIAEVFALNLIESLSFTPLMKGELVGPNIPKPFSRNKSQTSDVDEDAGIEFRSDESNLLEQC